MARLGVQKSLMIARTPGHARPPHAVYVGCSGVLGCTLCPLPRIRHQRSVRRGNKAKVEQDWGRWGQGSEGEGRGTTHMGRGRWQACLHGGTDISKQCLSLITTGCTASSALTISLWTASKAASEERDREAPRRRRVK